MHGNLHNIAFSQQSNAASRITRIYRQYNHIRILPYCVNPHGFPFHARLTPAKLSEEIAYLLPVRFRQSDHDNGRTRTPGTAISLPN
jgi:hypothetical protein